MVHVPSALGSRTSVRTLMWHRKHVVEGRRLDKQRTEHYLYYSKSFSMKCQSLKSVRCLWYQRHVMECSHVAIIYLPKAFSCQIFNYRKSMRHLKARIADKWNSLVIPTCTRLYLCVSGLFVVPRLCDARWRTQSPEIFRFFRKHLHDR